jgi:SAM-dependent methyltransferase
MSKLKKSDKPDSDEYIMSYLSEEHINTINKIYNKITSDSEFELMFFNYNDDRSNVMSFDKFLGVMEYLSHRSKNKDEKLEKTKTLDVIYSPNAGESFRITLNNLETINKNMKLMTEYRNHVIFSSFVSRLLEKDKDKDKDKSGKNAEDIHIIKKKKSMENILDINDFNMRVRMAEELQVSKDDLKILSKLKETERNSIIFRYKERVSLITHDTPTHIIRIDLTSTKLAKFANKIETTNPRYELEIDLQIRDKSNTKNEYLEDVMREATQLLKILQQSNFIIPKSLQNEILSKYVSLIGADSKKSTNLDARQTHSLEIQHVTDILPNKFAVTDKADGDRFFLIIEKNHIYLISTNLIVKNTGIKLDNTLSKYNGTILDGEYIFLPGKRGNRHLFMVFDCLRNGDEDVRKISAITDRLKKADDVIQNCFIFANQKGYELKDYSGEFNTKSIINFHNKQIVEYMNILNSDIEIEKKFPLIRRKYFIPVLGGSDNEIFAYSQVLWNSYTVNPEIKCPYHLDGLIYHPLDQKYVTGKDTKYVEYKWKPPEKNSIDFYVQFERDRDTRKIVSVYDNSKDEYLSNKPYRICNLYVGQMGKTGEQPTLFQPEQRKYLAYLFLKDGEARDLDNNIIQDKTVVEFYYNNDPNTDERTRWVPIRTRYDKTESVMRFKRRYGNYYDIANKVWRSIANPILMRDFDILSNEKLYSKHIEALRSRIDHSIIMSEKNENAYYQIRTNLAIPMRNFHNWIKDLTIFTYCNPRYGNVEKQHSVLDIACGLGGDIMKFYFSKVSFYVGIDIDYAGLISATDGALSRYTRMKKTHPNFPKMTFIHADGGALLNYEDQARALGSMTKDNRMAMEKFFPLDPKKRTTFDRINCQFAIHYFFENQNKWENFCENVRMSLKPGGYMVFTTFDAERIVELFRILIEEKKTKPKINEDVYTAYYSNTKGERKKLFELVKKFQDTDSATVKGVGHSVDVHNAFFMQEDKYITEYLVDKRFVESELGKRCNLELIDTDLFDNQFEIQRAYFDSIIEYESNTKTRDSILRKVKQYYDQSDEVNRECFKISRLNRYYVFRRKDSNNNYDKKDNSLSDTTELSQTSEDIKPKPKKNK